MTAPESESASSTAPVTELGRVLRELLRRETEIDRREVESGEARDTKAELWRQTNLQAIDGIELAIASIAARELSEAAVQVLIAAGYANQIVDELEDPRLREAVLRLARLLRSALPVVARSAGLDLAAYAAGHYAQGERDWPFPPAEPDEASLDQSAPASAEPQDAQRGDVSPASRSRPSSLSLVGPQLQDSEDGSGRERDGEDPDEPRAGAQNEIVMPILDLLFAEGGCSTKRPSEPD